MAASSSGGVFGKGRNSLAIISRALRRHPVVAGAITLRPRESILGGCRRPFWTC